MKKMMLIGMVVVMMLGLVGCNSEEKDIVEKIQSEEVEGFVPAQVEEESQEIADVVEEVIDTENLQNYYDATQYVGTPRLVDFIAFQAEGNGKTIIKIDSNYSPTIAYDDRLENMKEYQCIIVDNNTPEDESDDIVVYIFTE